MKQEVKDRDYIEIADFILSSFLIYNNISLVRIDKVSPTRALFLFPRDERTKDLISLFSSMSAEVEPLAFSSAQKRLKQLLYLALRQ
jgi:hypothetical protein